MPEETTRYFLERRERELANRLELAVANVEQLRIELDEVRRAKTALNHIDAQNLTNNPNLVGHQTSAADHDHLSVSIKQLVLLALRSSRGFAFNGASAAEIRDFIKDAFGRDIERTSLSPQLSRLRDEGRITSHFGGKWRLSTNYVNKAPPGDDPDGAQESPDVGG